MTQSYPLHTQGGGTGVIDTGGGNIVAEDPNNPDYLPNLAILDLHLEKGIKLSRTVQLQLVVDGFNVFNTNTATDIRVAQEGYGTITNIPQGRRWRGGVRVQF
jgi:hypothetical protein